MPYTIKSSEFYKSMMKISLIALTTTILTAKPVEIAKDPSAKNSPLKLQVAGYNFDKTKALFDGKVKIKGVNASYHHVPIGDMNTEAFSGKQRYDITEIGMSPFMLAYANEGFRDYTLLPIFLIRTFRHKSIFISTDSGIKKPEDLKGKVIATLGYSSSSLTWIRGLLHDEYGVSPQDVTWITSAKDSSAGVAGKISKQEQIIPKNVKMTMGTPRKDESELLLSGEADALFHAAEPKAYIQGNPKVARLFSDVRSVESNYYKKTGIFPIMHAVAIRTSLLKKHPWLAKAVFEAYSQSKTVAYQKMLKVGWAANMLPWFSTELEATRKLMGDNFYSYGLDEKNTRTLNTLFRYSYEQGLASRKLTIEELFDPLGHTLIEGK